MRVDHFRNIFGTAFYSENGPDWVPTNPLIILDRFRARPLLGFIRIVVL